MYKKYNVKTGNIERVVIEPEDPKKVEARTKSFIQWVKFNKANPEKMALAILKHKNMHFLANCEMLIDDTVQCKGKTYDYYCYKWKDNYFELINKARKLFWRYIETKS